MPPLDAISLLIIITKVSLITAIQQISIQSVSYFQLPNLTFSQLDTSTNILPSIYPALHSSFKPNISKNRQNATQQTRLPHPPPHHGPRRHRPATRLRRSLGNSQHVRQASLQAQRLQMRQGHQRRRLLRRLRCRSIVWQWRKMGACVSM
ncbi:hypothetical protein ABW21_db0204758 [Orbilia brochopaga]|nr:hypothetical protein ABW21_db0204758 [Drechslerella brochopaga]